MFPYVGIVLSQLGTKISNNQVKRNIGYNLERVISYSVLGGIVGAVGSFMTTDVAILNGLPIILGILMVFMGLNKVGFLMGFMPCGPLQLMQLYAFGTGSFAAGALSMFFFSFGTVPLILGLGLFLSKMSVYSCSFVYKIGGALIIVLGLNMTMSGMVTVGINTDLSFD